MNQFLQSFSSFNPLILYCEINVLGLALLSILLINRKSKWSESFDQKLFDIMIITVGIMLILDTPMWLVDGQQFKGAYTLNILCSTLYYLLSPLVGCLWLFYTDFKIHGDKARLKRRFLLYSSLLWLNIIISLINIKTGWLFTIDPVTNLYARGTLFWSCGMLPFVYPFWAAVVALIHARIDAENRREYNMLALFVLPPVIGGVMQCLIYGLSFIWISMVVSVFFIFINVQNHSIFTDELTGVNNRRNFNRYLGYYTKNAINATGDKRLIAIVMDVDEFKSINDIFGHAVGDNALIDLAEILKGICVPKRDFLARTGGDEFVIISRGNGYDYAYKFEMAIQSALDEFNGKSHAAPYTLSVSMGCTVFGEEETDSADSFISRADKAMYLIKNSKKRRMQSVINE